MTALPVITDVGEMIDYLVARGAPLTHDEFFTACCRCGRNAGPALLYVLYGEQLLDEDVVAASLEDVWCSAEFPEIQLNHDGWRELFDAAGYTDDGKPAARPTHTLTLWRGSRSHPANWSWTADRTVAAKFASGDWFYRPGGRLWRAEVEPWRLFAHITTRGEAEYVVDTDGLTIVDEGLISDDERARMLAAVRGDTAGIESS